MGAEALPAPSVPSPGPSLLPGDLRAAGQQLPPPRHHGLGAAVPRGGPQGTAKGQTWPSALPQPPPGLSWGRGLASSITVFCPPPPPQFLAFTCGLLCGALETLGFRSLVTASAASLPACELLGEGRFASLTAL